MTVAAGSVEYRTTDIAGIGAACLFRERANTRRYTHIRTFKNHYGQMAFSDRKTHFAGVVSAGVLAIETVTGYAGYCIRSIPLESAGESESIYIDEAYRPQEIDPALMNRVLAWLDENGSIENRVSVADGNEEPLPFHRWEWRWYSV
ncbi:MAG: hypothetical protein WCY70_08590 [Methanoculleus sp.]